MSFEVYIFLRCEMYVKWFSHQALQLMLFWVTSVVYHASCFNISLESLCIELWFEGKRATVEVSELHIDQACVKFKILRIRGSVACSRIPSAVLVSCHYITTSVMR